LNEWLLPFERVSSGIATSAELAVSGIAPSSAERAV
jgi:hypothetical protein